MVVWFNSLSPCSYINHVCIHASYLYEALYIAYFVEIYVIFTKKLSHDFSLYVIHDIDQYEPEYLYQLFYEQLYKKSLLEKYLTFIFIFKICRLYIMVLLKKYYILCTQ